MKILRDDKRYPESLRQIKYAPKQLYVRGSLPDGQKPSAAIIGARRCSSYGKEMAEWFGRELAGWGVQIISGMAMGVDGIAQRAALKAGGKSYGVLGCGLDICYPECNRDLYEMLPDCGGIITEYPEGTQPAGFHFPVRNRIISALSDIILVVEAKEKSGTLITVDFALEQGKDVFAIPGRINDSLSTGCNMLLRQGAYVALEPGDVLELLYRRNRIERMPEKKEKKGQGKRILREEELSEKERFVYGLLSPRRVSLQTLYEMAWEEKPGALTGISELMSILMQLVAHRAIRQERGEFFIT